MSVFSVAIGHEPDISRTTQFGSEGPISDIESFARIGTFCLTDLGGKPILGETLSPNDIAVDALKETGRCRPARGELKRSEKPCFLCRTAGNPGLISLGRLRKQRASWTAVA